MGALPLYSAARVRLQSKTGDMKSANGGTPPGPRVCSRYQPSRDTGCLKDEPEDMNSANGKAPSEHSMEDSASSVTPSGWRSGKKVFKKLSVRFDGDKKPTLWARVLGKLGRNSN